jgi:glycyl-tRNA synthetase beta chain
MPDFLLELRCEEIPARMQAGARAELEKLFRKEMDAVLRQAQDERIEVEITVWSTPRRLALIARDLPLATAAVSEELKGPKLGAPPQALEGFLRKTGLTQDQLAERDGVYFAVTEKPGRATAEVLAEAIPAIIRGFSWPKSMRWGAASLSTESLRWVRPLSGIVALLGEELIECEVGGVVSGRATLGHRFHSHGDVTIGSASDYQQKLRAAHVIVDHEERQDLIRERAAAAAHAEGLLLVADEGLVVENAGLTEWPVPLLGRFDEAFLDVPPEVIQLTARTNQKYFVCEKDGKLANAFVCTANIVALDGGTEIVAGNRKVLAARLSDARFFWEQDQKKTLASHAEGLARITFHEKLGTVADKVDRVAKLARWLVEEGIVKPSPLQGRGLGVGSVDQAPRSPDRPHPNPSPEGEGLSVAQLADLAEQAARLCKADLVAEMVGEFPELQGLMGGYYAREEGLDPAVAEAIRDHYKPVGQGDDVPTAPVTVAVSLADKLDSLVGFFLIDEKPTGSKDPFALRRAALGVIRLITQNGIRFKLTEEVGCAHGEYVVQLTQRMHRHFDDGYDKDPMWGPLVDRGEGASDALKQALLDFLADRLKVQQREAGVRHDLIDAVFALGGEDDLVRLLARVHALQAFVGTPDGANLLAGYKRAANILKKEGFENPSPLQGRGRSAAGAEGVGAVDQSLRQPDMPHPNPSPEGEGLSYTPEPAEKALIDALAAAAPRAEAAVDDEDFAAAMAALASLRAPIDAFFEDVTVNDSNPDKRSARLALLAGFRDAVHTVADFSRIEG